MYYVKHDKMTKLINWGIIGCGNVTEQKSGPAFGKTRGSKLVAVMRRDAEKARDYALRHNVPRWYNNATELINDKEVNAVYVATPPDSHAEYAIQAMYAGKPAYVEKPMALNYDQCQEMIKVSEQTGMSLFVAYYRRRLPGFLKIKELLNEGIIGKPNHFEIRFITPPRPEDYLKPLPWRVIPESSGGGYLHDLGSHQLDLLDFLLEPLKLVDSDSENRLGLYAPADFVKATFKTDSGISGSAFWNFGASGKEHTDTIVISGEKGRIEFSCFDFTQTKVVSQDHILYYDNPRPEHVQSGLIELITEEIRQNKKDKTNAISAARATRLLDNLSKR